MTKTLETKGLIKSFKGRRVVDQVSINVQEGEVVGLLGPNGAGKTTTFYMVVGLMKPDQGRVLLGGGDVTEMPMFQRAREGIGYLTQEPSIFRKLTVEENILAVLEPQALPQSTMQQNLADLLQELSISHLAKQKAYSLSGGERRRVEISRALACNPSFMLLDEPFAGIDPMAVADIQSIVGQLRQRGIGILITDHNVRETLQITDRAYIINEGTILDEGDAEHIASSEKVRRFYLGDKFQL